MRVYLMGAALAASTLIAGCTMENKAARKAAETNTLHYKMVTAVVPHSQTIWDLSGVARTGGGTPFPAGLTDAQWQKLETASAGMTRAALEIAAMPRVVVAAPHIRILDEGNPGAPGAAQVQAYIDANPAGFAEYSRALAATGEQLQAAIKARDTARLGEITSDLDRVCEACHVQYWYPKK